MPLSETVAASDARPLLIFPCNGNGIEALDCLGAGHRLIGFVDDSPHKQGARVHGYPVLDRSALSTWSDALVLAVPGSPASFRARSQIVDALGVADQRFTTVIHPAAHVSPLARIGRNVLVMAGAVITSDAVVGDHVCILPNTVIHHEVVIGPWTLIGANVTIAGNTTIGENCYIGSGTSVMNGLQVGNGALIGLGSNVIHNVSAGETWAGNPARRLS